MIILFSRVEIPNNYIFEDGLIRHSPRGRAASYELCLLFTYSLVLVIGRYTEVLWGGFFLVRGKVGEEGYGGYFYGGRMGFPALFI